MTSSMATGDKKWASSTRRSGMTVLGKVPKPINLPSQKLENQGNDPNVEIVPKGTLSWGSRTSSPASNAWGSSSLSLSTDNGRPSSGGSCTRPSTAGSEKAHESTNNAWGSNSRPSSASGSFTSNQAPGNSLRPRSADTRPGSSQLSRFAEPSSENSGAWTAASSADNMVHLKKDNFSLSSGDFPTLGSEKENPAKNDHSQPQDEDTTASARINSETVASGGRDGPSYADDGSRHHLEKWHGDQQHRNPNMPGPQQFASWHGAPISTPPLGVWYRGPTGRPPYVPPGGPPYGPPGGSPYGPSGGAPYGPAGGPPYGPVVGPGGFPMEHPYYHPPMPPTALGNSQPLPLHGAVPRGPHQKNGEMYRPHMPEVHFRPGMPMRPGFFPGPVPYEGYYPPPMGYCGPNDRDVPFMGQAGPAVYDRHTNPNAPDHGNSQSVSAGHGSTEKHSGLEPGASAHRQDPHEQYTVLLKQKGEDQEWGYSATTVETQFERGRHHRSTSGEQNRGREFHSIEKTEPGRMPASEGRSIRGSFTHTGSQFHGKEMSPQIVKSPRGVTNLAKKLEDKPSHSVEVVAAPKESSLIQKIEGLNAKARGADGKQDLASNSDWDEDRNKSHISAKAPQSTNTGNTSSISHARSYIAVPAGHQTVSHGIVTSTENRYVGPSTASGPSFSRRPSNNVPQIRTDYRGKGKTDFSEAEGRHKKADVSHTLTAADFPTKSGSLNSEHVDRVHLSDPVDGKDAVLDSIASLSDPVDIQAQRARMREIAKQRAIERQREEEERIKEQRAKAQAKLEELDRRTQMNENSSNKVEMSSSGGVTGCKADEDQPELTTSSSKAGAPKTAPTSEIEAVKPNDSIASARSLVSHPDVSKDRRHDSSVADHQPLAQQADVHHAHDSKGEPEQNGSNSVLKPKRKGFREKQKLQPENGAIEKIVKSIADATAYRNESVGKVANNTPPITEPVVQQRIKNNRCGKNKQKVEEAASSAVMPSPSTKDKDLKQISVDIDKTLPTRPTNPNHFELQIGSQDWPLSTEPHESLLKEEIQSKVNNNSRHQNPRRQPRNQQGNRVVDKLHNSDAVVWAPVKQQHKEVNEDSSNKEATEESRDFTRRGDNVQGNTKNKRAEMERYVPKPVAKELAHQGGPALPATTVDQAVLNQKDSSASEVGVAAEQNIGQTKFKRQSREPEAWRQQGSAESSVEQGQEHGSFGYTDVRKDVHRPTEQNQMEIPDSRGREKIKFSDGWNSPDEWSIHNSNVHDSSVPVVRDQGSFGRGKRQYNKGSRNLGTNAHDCEHGRGQSGKVLDVGQSHFVVTNSGEPERTASQEKERRRDQENPSAHWQTNSQDFSAHNHRGSRPGGSGHNPGVDTGRFVKKEPVPHGTHHQPKDHGNHHANDHGNHHANDHGNHHHHHPRDVKLTDKVANRPNPPAKSSAGEIASTEHQDSRHERKVVRGSNSSNSISRAQVEQAPLPPPVEHQHERPRSSSGLRKYGNHYQNNRFGRGGHEPLGDWNSNEQDRRYHNQLSGRGRQRHNIINSSSHYEYKPKGQGQSSSGGDGGSLQHQRQSAPIRVEAGGSN